MSGTPITLNIHQLDGKVVDFATFSVTFPGGLGGAQKPLQVPRMACIQMAGLCCQVDPGAAQQPIDLGQVGAALTPQQTPTVRCANRPIISERRALFYDVTELSKLGIPSIAVVFGSSTAGGAYQPGMSDYNIFIKERSKVFLGGPPLVQMATGEVSDDETLGGAQMHAETSGLADYLAERTSSMA